MSADELKRAAKTLREHAHNAMSGRAPWVVDRKDGSFPHEHAIFVGRRWTPGEDPDDPGWEQIADLSVDASGFAFPLNQALGEAAYIALMHPPVALALADWLEFVDREADRHVGGLRTHIDAAKELMAPGWSKASVVARAILREEATS